MRDSDSRCTRLASRADCHETVTVLEDPEMPPEIIAWRHRARIRLRPGLEPGLRDEIIRRLSD